MSVSGLFDIGKSALFASQMGLYVTGHNIANANTPGFNRQEIILETSSPVATGAGFLGRGVRIAGIKRHFDRFIYNQLLLQTQRLGLSRTMSNVMLRIEETFNDIKGLGLSGALQEFFNAWQEVATTPELFPARNLLLSKAKAFLNVAKDMEGSIKDILKEIETSLEKVVHKINSLLSKIGDLNGKILQIGSGLTGTLANDLRDQREEILRELSGLMDVTYYEEDNGSITVMQGTLTLVERERVSKLSAVLGIDSRKGIYINSQDITDRIRAGELGGLLSARQDLERYQLFGLRRLLATIIKEINIQHRQGYGLDGSTGNDFFTPINLHIENYTKNALVSASISDMSQLTLDEYEISFDGTNYYVRSLQTGALVTSGPYVPGNTISFDGIDVTISGAIFQNERIVISPLKDIVVNAQVAVDAVKIAASSSSSLPSDNLNALFIINIFRSPLPSLGGANFEDYYKGLVTTTATLSITAQDSIRFEQNLMDEIRKQRESLSGVSLDEEAVNLIKFQKAFEAGARIIKVADELLETIINL